jgi:hypothetical protein
MPHHKNSGSFKKGNIPWSKGKHLITWNKGISVPKIALLNSPHWKGDMAGQSAMHYWFKKYFPKPDKCQQCGKKTDILDVSNVLIGLIVRKQIWTHV